MTAPRQADASSPMATHPLSGIGICLIYTKRNALFNNKIAFFDKVLVNYGNYAIIIKIYRLKFESKPLNQVLTSPI